MTEAISPAYSAASAEPRVSSLELFFDLVFVPTALIGISITPLAQVAALVAVLIVGAIVDSVLTNRHSIR